MIGSELYKTQITNLTDWLVAKTIGCEPFELHYLDYNRGVDALPNFYQKLSTEAFDLWLKDKNYELSYNQMCIAMFDALFKNNIVKVI